MSIIPPSRAPVVTDLLTQLLDKQYVQQTSAVIRAIANGSTSGIIEQRLKELDAEAARLAAAGQKLTADNPVVRALLADFQQTMNANGALINSVAGDVQQGGINAAGPVTRQLALPGYSDSMLTALGVQWNVPDPEAVAQLVNYTSGQAWRDALAKYAGNNVQVAQNVAIRGMIEGWGPLRTARELRRVVEGVPVHTANQMMRTLQLTSLRDAQRVHRVANSHILEYQIRIAALDDRTCMACVALHGTEYPLDVRIDDHHAGRCTSVTKVKFLDRPNIQSGEDWFNSRPEEQQRAMMGNSAFEAWKAGTIKIRDFVGPYNDPVFGTMLRQRSLKNIIAGVGGEFDFIPTRPDFLQTGRGILPGMIETGLDNDIARAMSEYFSYSPNGDPIYSREAVRTGTSDLFMDIRQIGKVDPTLEHVDLIRLRAASLLAADEQLAQSVLSAKERSALLKVVSTDYDTSRAAIDTLRDMRLKGQKSGIVGGFQGDDFISSADADAAARLREHRTGT